MDEDNLTEGINAHRTYSYETVVEHTSILRQNAFDRLYDTVTYNTLNGMAAAEPPQLTEEQAREKTMLSVLKGKKVDGITREMARDYFKERCVTKHLTKPIRDLLHAPPDDKVKIESLDLSDIPVD